MNFVDPASGVDKSATRERILDAAAEVFATKGYHSSVVDDIVHDSNTSKGAVYFHFLRPIKNIKHSAPANIIKQNIYLLFQLYYILPP